MANNNVDNFFEQPGGNSTDNALNLGGTVKGKDGAQSAAIADATGGVTVDAEARAAINSALAALRNAGLIAE